MDSRMVLNDAMAALRSGRADVAETLTKDLVEKQPANAQAHFAWAMVAGSIGDRSTAIQRLQGVLKLDARHPGAIQWMAILCTQAGDYVQGEKFAHRALLAEPGNPHCLLSLGVCLENRGDDVGALETFTKMTRLAPNDGRGYFARGRALRRLHRAPEALAAFKQGAVHAPDVESYLEIAEMESFMGRAQDSVDTYRQALLLDPASPRVHRMLARTLTDVGRLEEAEAHWAAFGAAEPVVGMMRAAKAQALIHVGRFEEGQAEAEKALSLNPALGMPYYFIAASRRMEESDRPFVASMEDRLMSTELADSDRCDIHYALGKAYDNLGEYEKAMANFDRANALRRGKSIFDKAAFRQSIDRRIATFTKELLSPIGEDTADLPLFVVGVLRSGTTLLEQMLSRHPEIGGAGEHTFWRSCEYSAVDYAAGKVRPIESERLKKEYTELLKALSPGFPHVIDKNPANLEAAGLIHVLYPSSRILCMRRSAVDTALSIWMTHMQTDDLFVYDREAIVFACKEYLRLMDHWRANMPPSRYMEVSYEGLTQDPEGHIRQILEFCGLPWAEECVHPERNTSLISTPSFWQARQPVYKTSTERWRKYEPWLGSFEELIGL